jgi:hypothetical protein
MLSTAAARTLNLLLLGQAAAAPAPAPLPVPTLVAPPPEPAPPPPPKAPPSLLAPVGPPQAAPVERYDLRPAKDGSGDLVYESKPFTARVAPDGTVSFKDHRVSDFTWRPPWLPVPVHNGITSVADTVGSLVERRKPPKPETGTEPDESFLVIPKVSRYRPDPREDCRGCDLPPLIIAASASGKYDLTEDLQRFSGHDPHRMQKARFLAATRDARIKMAVKANAERVREAAADLVPTVRAIADDERRTPTERRAILEALRDEMDQTTPEGRTAAATIERFLAPRPADPSLPAPRGEGP